MKRLKIADEAAEEEIVDHPLSAIRHPQSLGRR
jgi:hypothetical protein